MVSKAMTCEVWKKGEHVVSVQQEFLNKVLYDGFGNTVT